MNGTATRKRPTAEPSTASREEAQRTGDPATGRGTGEPYRLAPDHRVGARIRVPTRAPGQVPQEVWESWIGATLALTRLNAPGVQPVFLVQRRPEAVELMVAPPAGRPLRRAAMEERPSALQAVDWLLGAAEALAQVHGAGGAHGHLDSLHVHVDRGGRVQLSGMALADPALEPGGEGELFAAFEHPPSEEADMVGFVRLALELAGFVPELEPLAEALEEAVAPAHGGRPDFFDLHATVARFRDRLVEPEAVAAAPSSAGEHPAPSAVPPAPGKGRRLPWLVGAPAVALLLGAALWMGSGRHGAVAPSPGPAASASAAVRDHVPPAPANPALARRMERARAALVNGDTREAGRLLEEILADPTVADPVPALEALGVLRLKEGRSREAAGLLERALRLAPSAHRCYVTALAQAASGREADARKTVREGLARWPDDPSLGTLAGKLGGVR